MVPILDFSDPRFSLVRDKSSETTPDFVQPATYNRTVQLPLTAEDQRTRLSDDDRMTEYRNFTRQLELNTQLCPPVRQESHSPEMTELVMCRPKP